MRIDLHVHSKHSKRPNQWILQKIGCPESFTEPLQIYRIAKSRGMSHVTITDHNSIAGALEIAHLADTFISEEITTYFPENGCKIHVLALNIDERRHAEIQKLRENIYDLAAYLCREKITSVVAHPLYAVNDRLELSLFEKLLLLFQNFELNGARNARENQCLRGIMAALSQETIAQLADCHNLPPLYPRSWEKRLFGGSDDHSSLYIARTYSEIDLPGNGHPTELDAPGAAVRVVGCDATPLTLAHNLYGIAYQFYREKFRLDRYADKNVLMRFLDRSLRMDENRTCGMFSKLFILWQHRRDRHVKTPLSDSLTSLLLHEARQLITQDPEFFQSTGNPSDYIDFEGRWFSFVNRASNGVMNHFGNHMLDNISGANVFNIFTTIGSAGGMYTLLAPFFVAFAQFSKDRRMSEIVSDRFLSESSAEEKACGNRLKVAHFTDTFYEVNGVALTLQQQVQMALDNHKQYTLVTCHREHCEERPGVKNFMPIGQYELPEYPELKILYPPILEILEFCYRENFNAVHIATPGPVGLAALAVAKILKLPVSGTYHTSIPQYVQILTGDGAMEDLAWKYVLWFYDQIDIVYTPSQSTCDELTAKGISRAKIRVYPRGIDLERFNPAKRNGVVKKRFGIQGGVKFIYVGRVSKEKNLHLLVQVMRELLSDGHEAHLIVVGDGPYLFEMQQETCGLPCYFTGYLDADRVAEMYASCDILVFPSATDTFGNVVLEAQASGLPVIVSDQGGPCENMLPGKTGFVVRANQADSLHAAMLALLSDSERIRRMGQAARRYVESRSFESAFLQMWEMYGRDNQRILHPSRPERVA